MPSLLGLGLLEQINATKTRVKNVEKQAVDAEASKTSEATENTGTKRKGKSKKVTDVLRQHANVVG